MGGVVVAKFGGSILRSGEGFREAAATTAKLAASSSVVVVVSAMKGVTDTLLSVARGRAGWEEKLKKVMEAYYTAARTAIGLREELGRALSELGLLFDELLKLVWASKVVGEVTDYTVASIAAFGEKLSAALMAHTLESMNVRSRWLTGGEAGLTAEGSPLEAVVNYDTSSRLVRERLQKLAKEGVTPVVTGFNAYTPEGRMVLLGRGGSDYTATLLARFLDAREVHLYTDVDGIKTADPRLVPEAKHIPYLSAREAEELALLGAKRMHPRTFEPLMGTRVRVLITKPGAARCTIVGSGDDGPPVKAATLAEGLAVVAVEGGGLAGRVGVAAKTMEAAASLGVNIKAVAQPLAETQIALVVNAKDSERLAERLSQQLGSLGVHVRVREVAAVSVVGYGVGEPETALKAIAKAASEAKVYGVVWSPGSYSITILVQPSKAVEALRRIHREVVEPWWTR